jgi:hypothetical protein
MEYTSALDLLNEKSWATADKRTKLGALQAIEDEMARRQGRDPAKVVQQKMDPIPGLKDVIKGGQYSMLGRAIVVNEALIDPGRPIGGKSAMEELVGIVIHEGRHCYQFDAVSGDISHSNKGQLQDWKANYASYTPVEVSLKGYRLQPIESDAYGYSRSWQKIVLTEALDRKASIEAKPAVQNAPESLMFAKKEPKRAAGRPR